MISKKKKGKKMNLDDWRRLNKGTRPIAKTARAFGGSDMPDETMSESEIPYRYRRRVYEEHLKDVAAKKPTSKILALGGGAVGAGAVGAGIGHRLMGGRGAAIGGAIGAAGGALGGALVRSRQKRRAAKAKEILKSPTRVDKEMAKHLRQERAQKYKSFYKSSSWQLGVVEGMNKTAIGYREAMAAGLTAGAIYGGHDRWDRSTRKHTEDERRFKYRRLRNTLAGAGGGAMAGAGLVMAGNEIINALRKKSS